MDNGSPSLGTGQTPTNRLEALLDEYLVRKAPFALPENAKEIIVKISPYIVLILVILSLPIILAVFGLTAFLTPFAVLGGYTASAGALALVAGLLTLVAVILELMAVSGLFRRTRKGWRLVFYATLVSLVSSLLALNIVSGLIGALIGWYILFQVKDKYRN